MDRELFGFPAFAWISWAFGLATLLLALATIPLAWRGAGRRAWIAHALLVTANVVGMTSNMYVLAYRDLVPWWQLVLAELASVGAATLAAGWAARATARRGGARRRWLIALSAPAAFVAVAYAGWWLTRGLVPDAVLAVQ